MTRELDALVAEKMMGWKWAVTKENGIVPFRRLVDPDIDYSRIPDALLPDDKSLRILDRGYPHYSIFIDDAWPVVEKFDEYDIYKDEHRVVCKVAMKGDMWSMAIADTVPEAICLAALKAVEQ